MKCSVSFPLDIFLPCPKGEVFCKDCLGTSTHWGLTCGPEGKHEEFRNRRMIPPKEEFLLGGETCNNTKGRCG